MLIVHHCNKKQIEMLREIFTHPEQVVFKWPMADGEHLEKMEWVTPEWVNVMDAFVIAI